MVAERGSEPNSRRFFFCFFFDIPDSYIFGSELDLRARRNYIETHRRVPTPNTHCMTHRFGLQNFPRRHRYASNKARKATPTSSESSQLHRNKQRNRSTIFTFAHRAWPIFSSPFTLPVFFFSFGPFNATTKVDLSHRTLQLSDSFTTIFWSDFHRFRTVFWSLNFR